jgi:hypothetical protein
MRQEKKHRETSAHIELRSGLAFGDFRVGQLVTFLHYDDRHPDVPLWRAKILKSNAGADGKTGVFDVRVLEIVKDVAGVEPGLLFRPSVNMPAV